MKWSIAVISFCVATAISPFLFSSDAQPEKPGVRVWEEPLVIPTYLSEAPDTTPIFWEGRSYVATKGRIYPYPAIDRLTDEVENRTYKAIYLENRYVKLCVVPELGGRLFSAVDKTNGYDFFYRQHVMKPALIGMLGTWTSGGIEWNVPHIHRATSYLPVQSTTTENPDGSKTIWVGETEIRHRMKWIVGITLHPGRSYLETTMKLINRTPVAQSFIYFANAAVHAGGDYEVIFPPSTEFVTGHSKFMFSRWPISDSVYGGSDFREGVDISRRANHPAPSTMFAFNSKEDFFAGYDHDQGAGVVHVADHHVVPGKKCYTWGVGRSGQVWDKTLTDSDGPYIEIMAGGYSDNQPDYIWIEPSEVKIVKEYWYPFRRIGGVKNANTEAAVNLDVAASTARIGLHTSAEYRNAKVILRTKEKRLLEETVTIDPGRPYFKEISLPAGLAEQDLEVSVWNGEKQVIAYKPRPRRESPMPQPARLPPPPEEVSSVEELYLTGLRLQQFHAAAAEPDPYYEEALRRDPGHYGANTALGILYLLRGMFEPAREKLEKAVSRATANYTKPKDGQAHYYLGLADKHLKDFDSARDNFHKATWSWAWRSPGFFALAELACRNGAYQSALGFLEQSLSANTRNTRALNLRAAILRRLERHADAEASASAAVAIDPLDEWARRELRLAATARGRTTSTRPIVVRDGLTDDVQTFLELAVDYGNAGLTQDAVSALAEIAGAYPEKSRVHPMVYYYLGCFTEQGGDREKAARYYRLAAEMPTDYCFPFRLESIAVLRRAAAANPDDARAPYYLGNLLYDDQPAAAIAEWERARRLDDGFALVHRNLALAYARHERNHEKSIASLEKAIELHPDARFLVELDGLYEASGVSPEKRLAFLEKHHQTAVDRDDALAREIDLLLFAGRYDRALELVGSRRFHIWEGARTSVHDAYVVAHLLRGHGHRRDGRHKEAIEDFTAALEFPENLQTGGFPRIGKSIQVYYALGTAHEDLGNAGEARSWFKRCVREAGADFPSRRRLNSSAAEGLYWKARAHEKLGQAEKAREVFQRLIESGRQSLATEAETSQQEFGNQQADRARAADNHYILGLGLLGAGRLEEARSEFRRALALHGAHLGARYQIAALAE